jgi:hypothetical protein
MAERPWVGNDRVIQDRDDARLVLLGLELLRLESQRRDGGPAMSARFRSLYERCRIVASALPPATYERAFTISLPSSDTLITTAEAAAIWGTTRQAIRGAVKAGRLTGHRHGRTLLVEEYEVRHKAAVRRRHGSPGSHAEHDPGSSADRPG